MQLCMLTHCGWDLMTRACNCINKFIALKSPQFNIM